MGGALVGEQGGGPPSDELLREAFTASTAGGGAAPVAQCASDSAPQPIYCWYASAVAISACHTDLRSFFVPTWVSNRQKWL